MPLDADMIVDRRRLRRKLIFWRILAAVMVVGIVSAGAFMFSDHGLGSRPGPYIARIKISGLIRGDSERVEALDRLAKSSARAVVVHVDSPGGTTAGSEELHNALRKVAGRKPMVVVVDSLAASGGYIAAIAGDHIVAQNNSLVGSVGVIFQFPNVSELMKTVGVQIESIKSTPLKAAPSGYEPTSPEARAAIEGVVKEGYNWFKDLVADRRKISGETLERVSDGRIFSGRQALDLKMIDQIGDETAAIAWLAKERNIDAQTPVRDWQLKDRFSNFSFLHLGVASLLEAVGLQSLAQRLSDTGTLQALERMNLDGLLALWHPSAAN
jgi:protease IV